MTTEDGSSVVVVLGISSKSPWFNILYPEYLVYMSVVLCRYGILSTISQLQKEFLAPMVPKGYQGGGSNPPPPPSKPSPPPPPVLRSNASLVRGSALKCSAVVVWSGVVTVPWVGGQSIGPLSVVVRGCAAELPGTRGSPTTRGFVSKGGVSVVCFQGRRKGCWPCRCLMVCCGGAGRPGMAVLRFTDSGRLLATLVCCCGVGVGTVERMLGLL